MLDYIFCNQLTCTFINLKILFVICPSKAMSEDLLSFKEYSPVHDSHSQGGSAQINVNSPSRAPYGATNTTNDPLQDLIDSMSSSVNVLRNEDRQQQQQPSGSNGEYRQQAARIDRR